MTEFAREAVRLVVLRDGNVLLARSARSGSFKFPGGGVEEGEDWKQAARRELEEETGLVAGRMTCLGEIGEQLSAKNKSMSHELSAGDMVRATYVLVEAEGEPREGDDVNGVFWTAAGMVLDRLTYETQREGYRTLVLPRLR